MEHLARYTFWLSFTSATFFPLLAVAISIQQLLEIIYRSKPRGRVVIRIMKQSKQSPRLKSGIWWKRTFWLAVLSMEHGARTFAFLFQLFGLLYSASFVLRSHGCQQNTGWDKTWWPEPAELLGIHPLIANKHIVPILLTFRAIHDLLFIYVAIAENTCFALIWSALTRVQNPSLCGTSIALRVTHSDLIPRQNSSHTHTGLAPAHPLQHKRRHHHHHQHRHPSRHHHHHRPCRPHRHRRRLPLHLASVLSSTRQRTHLSLLHPVRSNTRKSHTSVSIATSSCLADRFSNSSS